MDVDYSAGVTAYSTAAPIFKRAVTQVQRARHILDGRLWQPIEHTPTISQQGVLEGCHSTCPNVVEGPLSSSRNGGRSIIIGVSSIFIIMQTGEDNWVF